MSEQFRVFKVVSNDDNDAILSAIVTNTRELELFNGRPENNMQKFFILNKKGEEVDLNLNVIIKPSTSMESMIGALQNKFSSRKRR